MQKKQSNKCKKTTLQFNQNYYHQLDGLAMGSPLAPAMADICMNWLTNEVLAKIKNPPVIMRYVDDLFLAFDNPNDVEYVYQIFNSIHPNLKFTKEEENERKLPFLDVLITKTSNGIETTVYKKPTFSGLYTKWDSYTPTKYKRNLINNLLHRAHQICSSFTLLRKEFNQISLVLEKNGYPKNFLNKHINRFMEKHYGKDIPKENIFKDPRVKKFFMRLPFIREISPQIEKEINSFFAKLDFETKFLLINDTYSLKNVFKHKEQQQILHQYGVVYEISCNCGSSYIGQTSRNLITRINNHDPSSKTPQDTDVTRHLTDNPNHAVCFNNPIILARSDHWRKLLIKETLMIQQRNPDLNSDKASIPLYLFNV